MTTTVTVHVGGKYRAYVAVSHADGSQEDHIVEGDGERVIRMRHPADATIKISEEPISEPVPPAG